MVKTPPDFARSFSSVASAAMARSGNSADSAFNRKRWREFHPLEPHESWRYGDAGHAVRAGVIANPARWSLFVAFLTTSWSMSRGRSSTQWSAKGLERTAWGHLTLRSTLRVFFQISK